MPQGSNASQKTNQFADHDDDFENQTFKFDRKKLILIASKSNGVKMETQTAHKSMHSLTDGKKEIKSSNDQKFIKSEKPFSYYDFVDEDECNDDIKGDQDNSSSASKEIFNDETLTDNTSNDEMECQKPIKGNNCTTSTTKKIKQTNGKRTSQRLHKKTTFCNKKYQAQLMKKVRSNLSKHC